MLVKLNKLIRVLTKNTSLSVFVKQFCFSIFYGFFYTQLAFSSYFLCFLLWWSWETLSRNLMLEQLLVFFECSSIQFLIHSLLVRPPFVTYHSLCCARVTYAMSCHTIQSPGTSHPNLDLEKQKISLGVKIILSICCFPHTQFSCNQKVLYQLVLNLL